jgi:L-lactate dehydrogenase (cytochrome)/(S)-mandelate dehydrogenase
VRIEDCINLDDLRRAAKRRLPKLIYDFIEGGVDDEDGLVRNEDAFRRRALLPRYLVDVTQRDQGTELFGRRYASAFGIGPTGGIGNYRRGGDLMLAAAARDADIPFIMSGAATATMEEVARTAPEHTWFQLYSARDRNVVDDMVRRADELGLSTLVITVDVPVGANRERNRRNGFGRPLRLRLATKLDALRRPAWFADYLRHGIAAMADWQRYVRDGASADEVGEYAAAQLRAPITWAELARIRACWPRKLVLKGILRSDDALRAAELGVDGIIVSNHGARQLDRAPSALDVLPGIVAAVGERLTVMLDGGIRRGADVLIALSLGARFVFLGRPTLYGVVAGGQAGAAHAIGILRNEVDIVMGQIGCTALDQLGIDFVEWDEEGLRRNVRG